MQPPWWQTGVVYQIYPRSFADTRGNGVGDLPGVEAHLDHLAWLGVDAIWLSPIYRSPMADFGYDVADYRDVDPLFGDLDDLDRLLEQLHDRGMRLILDWVPNHTSDQHPWFVESRSARTSAKRDWYVWRDPAPDGGPPNNWVDAFTGAPAWTWDETTRQYYLHLFLPQQPDLNWSNPEVAAAMQDVLVYWLDRGVDGFRADVVHLIGKDDDLADDPPDRVGQHHAAFQNNEVTHAYLRDLRTMLDGYPGERMMVGEVNLDSTEAVATYYGHGDELHLAFNFALLHTPWDAEAWRASIERIDAAYAPRRAWPTWVLSNHDQPRHRSRYGSLRRARAAAVALLTLRGTPFLFQGEELGLADAEVPPERRVDPGGRDGARAPIPWTPDAPHGWAGAEPWLPWPPAVGAHNAATQRSQSASTAQLYRHLLARRRASPALRHGAMTWLDTPPGVLGYRRSDGDDERVVLVNFADETATFDLPGWCVEVDSLLPAATGAAFGGALAPEQGLLLARA